MPKLFQHWDGQHEERSREDALSILEDGSGPIVVTAGEDPDETDEHYTVHDDHEVATEHLRFVVTNGIEAVLRGFHEADAALRFAEGLAG